MKLRIAALVPLVSLLAGCYQAATERLKQDLVAADKAFCAASVKDGPKAAFLGVITRDGKLLGDRHAGADAVNNLFVQYPPTATLTREPAFADVSASGDLGYTWGRYTLTVPSPVKGKAPYIKMGTYVTNWRRQPTGGWKVVLDGELPDRDY